MQSLWTQPSSCTQMQAEALRTKEAAEYERWKAGMRVEAKGEEVLPEEQVPRLSEFVDAIKVSHSNCLRSVN